MQTHTKTKQEEAIKLLKRKSGATVEQMAEKLLLSNTKQARGIIDRLRAKGEPIQHVGPHRFMLQK